jgi:probable HAF family extracellular repeat protein
LGINDRGEVVGYSTRSDGRRHAFLYIGGSLLDLGTLGGEDSYAYRISGSGLLVGRAQNADGLYRPFIATIGSKMFDLSSLDIRLGGSISVAASVNSSGQVAGYFHVDGGHSEAHNRAFLYIDHKIIDLGKFGGEDSIAVDINDSGQVIGSYSQEPHHADRRAFLYRAGNMIDLGTLGGRVTIAVDINNSGQVAGHAQVPNGASHAFLYTNGSLLDLGTLPGGSQSFAYGINDFGLAVGASDTTARTLRAVLYSSGVIRDFNSLIPTNSGWVLTEARGINKSGQIVGTGVRNGQERAFLLTPTASAMTNTKTTMTNSKTTTLAPSNHSRPGREAGPQ